MNGWTRPKLLNGWKTVPGHELEIRDHPDGIEMKGSVAPGPESIGKPIMKLPGRYKALFGQKIVVVGKLSPFGSDHALRWEIDLVGHVHLHVPQEAIKEITEEEKMQISKAKGALEQDYFKKVIEGMQGAGPSMKELSRQMAELSKGIGINRCEVCHASSGNSKLIHKPGCSRVSDLLRKLRDGVLEEADFPPKRGHERKDSQ